MTKFTKDPSTHPANGPLKEERLIRVRDELAAAAKRSDGGNLGYMMADAAKAIDELLALRKAPQFPPSAADYGRDQFEEWFKFHHGDEHSIVKLHRANGGANYRDQYVDLAWIAWKDSRAAMLQGAEPVPATDNTAQKFESLGLIATSDERKMELPRCSKHPETELQVHPFEQLLSYPPQPVMYCPLCWPSVAKWVEFDKQLRQWKGVK
ncbi:MAG: hypothetical protein E6736_00785 [Leclercia adecarboxylata]|nr:hypothetical protein [Leclercia adecarboxylata]